MQSGPDGNRTGKRDVHNGDFHGQLHFLSLYVVPDRSTTTIIVPTPLAPFSVPYFPDQSVFPLTHPRRGDLPTPPYVGGYQLLYFAGARLWVIESFNRSHMLCQIFTTFSRETLMSLHGTMQQSLPVSSPSIYLSKADRSPSSPRLPPRDLEAAVPGDRIQSILVQYLRPLRRMLTL